MSTKIPNIGYRVSHILFKISIIGYKISINIGCKISYNGYDISYIILHMRYLI